MKKLLCRDSYIPKGHSISKKFVQFCTILLFFCSSPTISAATINEKTVTLEYKNVSLKTVVSAIEKQTDYLFVYDEQAVNIKKEVSISVKNGNVQDVLKKVLIDSEISFVIEGNSIILRTKELSKQKRRKISGIVTDQKGETVIGASVKEKGAKTGTITDFNGNFSLEVEDQSTLVISYIGYSPVNIQVGSKSNYAVKLEENSTSINEVVVVGFGTQKKVNLTGSISSVKIDEVMSSRSITNASSALSGLMPGITVIQRSGMAGNDNADLKIRGLGNPNSPASPLVVVDGMPDVDINRLNMADIESVTILKDAASSAIYGSRAANGVILITTKSGKGQDKNKISFTSSITATSPTRVSEFMSDYAKAMTLMQRRSMAGTSRSQLKFKDGTIDEWMAMSMIDPVRFPSTDWWGEITRQGVVKNNNLSFSGSNDKTNFFISAGALDNKGLQINNDYSRYNIRMNYDYKISNKINVGARISGNWTNMSYVFDDGFTEKGNTEIFTSVAGIYPYDAETGRFGGVVAYGEDPQASNMMVKIMNLQTHRNKQEANGSFFCDWSPAKGLTARVEAAMNYDNQFEFKAPIPTGKAYDFQRGIDLDKEIIGSNAGISNRTNTGYKTMVNAQLKYNTKLFGNHDLTALLVYNEEYWYKRYEYASRNDRIHPSLTEIDAALPEVQFTGGNSEEEGLRSLVGRLNYVIGDKYLLEANFRRDGSSRFFEGYQYGFFPSIALGWRFNQEEFLKPMLEKWLTNGKFRASYGSLGDIFGVGRYEQKEALTTSNYMIDGKIVKGFANSKMINRNLSWETTTVFNAGLDLGFIANKLTLELDYYDRLTSGMLLQSDMSNHLTGAYFAPRQNIGNHRNRGVELNMTWAARISKDFKYSVNVNASYNYSTLVKWKGYLDREWRYINMPYHYLYTYENTGIVQSWDEIYQNTPQGAAPGDILKKDLNGDGLIDSKDLKANPEYQRDRPTTNFALNSSISWKGFDLAILLQGSAGRKDFWLNGGNSVNFPDTKYAVSQWHWDNPWSLDNRQGPWPRLGGNGTNSSEGNFWLDNMAFLRCKNIQFGYSLPKKITKFAGISNLRLYLSAENIFTITSHRGLDPEKNGDDDDMYPVNKSFTFGINLDI